MVSIGFISIDVFILILLIAVLILLSYKKGKKNLAALILAMYPALVVFNNMPFVEIDGNGSKALIFLITYLIFFALAKKYTHVKKNHTPGRKWTDSILLALSFIVLFMSVYIYAVPSLANIYGFSPTIVNLISEIPFGVALIIPIVVLFITSKKDVD
jgi:hypothetical protein